MALRINDVAPNFHAETTIGKIDFHEWMGEGYAVLMSHPRDFTGVCTTEFAAAAKMADQFAARSTKVIGLSVDPLGAHLRWKDDIETYAGTVMNFPIIADERLEIARLYDMLPAEAWMPGQPASISTKTVRTTFIIGPEKRIEVMMIYPMTVGRNFAEILRALDALQMNRVAPVATPANWYPGDDLIVRRDTSTEDARAMLGEVDEVFPYLRKVKGRPA